MAEAERAYREAIGKAPGYVDPCLNLGVILCDAGRCDEAIALYRYPAPQRTGEAIVLERVRELFPALPSQSRGFCRESGIPGVAPPAGSLSAPFGLGSLAFLGVPPLQGFPLRLRRSPL